MEDLNVLADTQTYKYEERFLRRQHW